MNKKLIETFANRLERRVIAVTGASGYIGSALIDELGKYSAKVIGVSRKELVAPQEGIVNLVADIKSYNCWIDIVKQADVIFHLAGSTSVYAAARDPAANLEATLLPINHLMRAAKEVGRKPRVVFASTATVYGLTTQLPVQETIEPKPVTVYDLHKLFGEQQLALATQQGILDNVSLRLANIYGPSSSVSAADDRGILNKVTARALQGDNLKLYGGGELLRDYVYIQDVVDAFLFAGFTQEIGGNTFNLGTGVGSSIRNAFGLVARCVEEVTGRQVTCADVPWPLDADVIEFRNFVASSVKLSAATGWQAFTNLEEGIRALISEYVKRNDKLSNSRL